LTVLELRELFKHYHVGDGNPIRAVDGVSMRVAAGEFVALYGPSGSGKSTLIKLIAGALRPDRGTVCVNDRDIFTLSGSELDNYRLKQLGIIGSPHSLIAGATALKNASLRLILMRGRAKKEATEPLLIRLGLENRMKHRTEQLSLGERQRVVIARALVTNPSLVLADEPTGNLDKKLTEDILSLLRELCAERNATVLLVTHDTHAASIADRVFELRDGRLKSYEPDDTPYTLAGRQT
jgi:putative ABC transport system ATP-binding protein